MRKKPNDTIVSAFDLRKESFLRSLHGILKNLPIHLKSEEIFLNPQSSLDLSDRIVQIIYKSLNSDREKFINQLIEHFNHQKAIIAQNRQFLDFYLDFLLDIFRAVDQIRVQFKEDISFCREQFCSLASSMVAKNYESTVNESQFLNRISECHTLFTQTIPKLRQRYENEILEKDQKIDQLQKQIKNLQKTSYKANQQKEKAVESMSIIKNDLIQVQTANESMKETEKRCRIYEGEIQSLKKELNKKNDSIEQYLIDIQTSNSSESASKSIIIKLKSELSLCQNENKELKEKLNQLEIDTQTFKSTQSIQNADLQLMTTKLSKYDIIENQRDQLLIKCQQAQSINTKLASHIQELTQTNQDLQSLNFKLKKELTEILASKSDNDQLKQELETLKAKFYSVETSLNSKELQLNELTNDLILTKKQLKETDQDLINAKMMVTNQNDQINIFRNTIDQLETEKSRNIIEIQRLQNINFNYERQLHEKNQSEEIYTSKISKLNSQIHDFQNERIDLMQQVKDTQNQLDLLSEDQEIQRISIQQSQRDVEMLFLNESQNEDERINLHKEIDQLTFELHQTNKDKTNLEKQNNDIIQELEEIKQKYKRQKSRNSDLSKENKNLSSKNHEIKKENEAIKNELKLKEDEIVNLTENTKTLKKKNNDLMNSIKIKDGKLSSTISDKVKEINQFHSKLQSTTYEMLKTKEELKEAINQLNQHKEDKDYLIQQLKDLKLKEEAVQNDLTIMKSNSKSELDMHNNEITFFKKEMSDKTVQLQAAQKTISDIQSKIKQVEIQLGVKNLDDVPNFVNELKSQRSSLEKVLISIKSILGIQATKAEEMIQFIQNYKTNYDQLKQQELQIKALLSQQPKSKSSNIKQSTVYDDLLNLKKQYEDVIKQMKRLMMFFNVAAPENIFEKVKEMKTKENEYEKKELLIQSLFSNQSNIIDSISMQQIEIKKLKENENQLEKLAKEITSLAGIDSRNNSENAIDTLIHIKRSLLKTQKNYVHFSIQTDLLKPEKVYTDIPIQTDLLKPESICIDIPIQTDSITNQQKELIQNDDVVVQKDLIPLIQKNPDNIEKVYLDSSTQHDPIQNEINYKDCSIQSTLSIETIPTSEIQNRFDSDSIQQSEDNLNQLIDTNDETHKSDNYSAKTTNCVINTDNNSNKSDLVNIKQQVGLIQNTDLSIEHNDFVNQKHDIEPQPLANQKTTIESIQQEHLNSQISKDQSNDSFPITSIQSMNSDDNSSDSNLTSKELDDSHQNDQISKNYEIIGYKQNEISSNVVIYSNYCIEKNQDQIDSLQNDINILISLINSSFSIMLNTKFEITFPLNIKTLNSISSKIIEMKRISDEEHEEIEKLHKMAISLGFTKSTVTRIKDFIEFLIQLSIEKERTVLIENTHKELNAMRQMADQERKLFEGRKQKLNEKISQLRSTIHNLQEKLVKQEDNYLSEIEQTKYELSKAIDDIQTEKRIKEELLRIASNQIADFEFLKSKLTAEEYQLIQNKS